MSENQHWVDTKQELESDKDGNFTVKSKTQEKVSSSRKIAAMELRDFWDLTIKAIGLAAIAISLLSYIHSVDTDQQAQIDKLKTSPHQGEEDAKRDHYEEIKIQQAQTKILNDQVQNQQSLKQQEADLNKALSSNISLALLNNHNDLQKQQATRQLEAFLPAQKDLTYLMLTDLFNNRYRSVKEHFNEEVYSQMLLLSDPTIIAQLRLVINITDVNEAIEQAARIGDRIDGTATQLWQMVGFSVNFFPDTSVFINFWGDAEQNQQDFFKNSHALRKIEGALPHAIQSLQPLINNYLDDVPSYFVWIGFCKPYVGRFGDMLHPIPRQTDHPFCWQRNAADAIAA